MNRLTSFSLLIADDDETARASLCEILEPVGYRTVVAADGAEALEIIEKRIVDCLLLDVHMPFLSGLDLVRIVRQRDTQVPCVMMTGEASDNLLKEALSLQVFTVLRKPIERDVVRFMIRRALDDTARAN